MCFFFSSNPPQHFEAHHLLFSFVNISIQFFSAYVLVVHIYCEPNKKAKKIQFNHTILNSEKTKSKMRDD